MTGFYIILADNNSSPDTKQKITCPYSINSVYYYIIYIVCKVIVPCHCTPKYFVMLTHSLMCHSISSCYFAMPRGAAISDVMVRYIRMPQTLKYIHLSHSVWVDNLIKSESRCFTIAVYSSERAFNFQAGICIRANVTIEIDGRGKKKFCLLFANRCWKEDPRRRNCFLFGIPLKPH
jgi:hypothetical protein